MAKEINMTGDTFKLMLCGQLYVPNQDVHRYKSSVTDEIVGPGYTAGGAVVTSMTISYDAGGNVLSFDGVDVAWPASTISNAYFAVLYDATPATDANRPLVGYYDFGGPISSVAASFVGSFDPAGIGAVALA
ncbi:hypothetical protein H7J86_24630 [Mycobacterium hackensackense]|nr:hypothetical protein [Mycobacterium hackensackense]